MAKGRAAKGERVGDERGVGEQPGGVVTASTSPPPSASVSAANVVEGPPQWALELLGGMRRTEERLTKLEESREAARQYIMGVDLAKPGADHSVKSTIRARKCEVCNDVFEGPDVPFGQSHRCEECQKPGFLPRKCEGCRKTFSTDENVAPLMCKRCKGCQVCGTKTENWVCGLCIGKGHFACNDCGGLAANNMAWCAACETKKKAEDRKHFKYQELEGNWPDRPVSEANPALARA